MKVIFDKNIHAPPVIKQGSEVRTITALYRTNKMTLHCPNKGPPFYL